MRPFERARQDESAEIWYALAILISVGLEGQMQSPHETTAQLFDCRMAPDHSRVSIGSMEMTTAIAVLGRCDVDECEIAEALTELD